MQPDRKSRNRPLGLYVLISLQLFNAVILALFLLGYEVVSPVLRFLMRNPLFFTQIAGWVMVFLLVSAVVGLLLLKRWAWSLTMILTGVGLTHTIWGYFQGSPEYVAMLVYIVMVFYLNQREVQRTFQHEILAEPMR